MKQARRFFVFALVLSACALQGFGLYENDARSAAARDFNCAPADVTLCLESSQHGETYCARGCGKQAAYDCNGLACLKDPFGCFLSC